MSPAQLIDPYLAGPELLRHAVAGMTEEQLRATPIPGKWSTQQVVCHLADFEPIYADRIKRAIAEDEPTIMSGDPDAFAARLAYDQRNVAEELQLIAVVRKQVGRILATLRPEDFDRRAMHSERGPITIRTMIGDITNHIPHHVRFIEEKRRALGC
ncbi:MAG: DUF664 domain-containing protein [Acidimicrobiia bacterium]|nr:DUF664 domain-containing protein [Acidimicrobiia bacterium]